MGVLSDDDLVGVSREPSRENFLIIAAGLKQLGLHLTKKDVEAITSEVLPLSCNSLKTSLIVTSATWSCGEVSDISEEAARAAAASRSRRAVRVAAVVSVLEHEPRSQAAEQLRRD